MNNNVKRYECDLHCHTIVSDGNDTPVELILNAKKAGVKVLAITDHDKVAPTILEIDTLHGKREKVTVEKFGEKNGVTVIRGIEVSCETEVEDVHLVCFGCDWEDEFFCELQKNGIQSKIDGYKELLNKLQAIGVEITWDEVLKNDGRPLDESSVQKKTIFELMAKKGYTDTWSDAKLLVKTDPRCQIMRRKPDPCEVIQQVHKGGGIAILAHPFLISPQVVVHGEHMSREDYIERLILAGLDGIEACYTYSKTSYGGCLYDQEIERIVRTTYENKVSIISGGSDYHADHKKGVFNARYIGESGVTKEYFDRVIANKIRR